jgi:transposase
MLADQLDYVVGVDPHRDSHALAVVQVVSGAVVFEATVVASSDGYAHALKLADRHAPGRRAFAVEGTGSFGAGLTRFLTGGGEQVLEVSRLRRERRSGGKTDALDAVRAARSVLTSERPATPRAGGERQAEEASHLLASVPEEARGECLWLVLPDGSLLPGDAGGGVALFVAVGLTRPLGRVL